MADEVKLGEVITGADTDLNVFDATHFGGSCMIFTSDVLLSWIYVKGYKYGSGCSTTFTVYACDGSYLPTGSSLGSVVIDTSSWSTSTKYHYITFATPIALTANTQYCWVATASSSSANRTKLKARTSYASAYINWGHLKAYGSTTLDYYSGYGATAEYWGTYNTAKFVPRVLFF